MDIHRDAIPAEEYEDDRRRRGDQQGAAVCRPLEPERRRDRAFAQEIKAVADEEYPGLIKDIYIGKGNYNQELYPQALLLEFGTDEIEKDKAIGATEYMAEVLDQVLYGESAQAETSADAAPAATGIFWVIGIAIVGSVIYGLASTGKLSGMWNKLKRGLSELTGGLAGKKPGDEEEK